MFCYTKYWFIIQNNKKEEFRFFRRMNMISGSQLSFVIHWVWCIQHQMSLLQILYWSFSLSHNSLNSLRTVLIRNEALWDITYSERLWCQISQIDVHSIVNLLFIKYKLSFIFSVLGNWSVFDSSSIFIHDLKLHEMKNLWEI